MSFQEKSNLAILVITAGVFGWYFGIVIPPFFDLETAPPAAAVGGLLIGLALFLVALTVIAHILLAALSPKQADQSDERDRAIETRADARSGYVLAVGAVLSLGLLVFGAAPFWAANALLASLAASEIAKGVLRAIDYRRGF
ncbi:hypothetical protein [Marinicauda pacifica]|jgi:hypothetical protein|uniref:hypothetical protein n=1 Tax=Marinicauda pacifica TaxID=1133559 RepID=UPI0035C79464